MDRMQFRGFVFPHNPHKITVSHREIIATHFLPYKGEKAENMGNKLRQVTCSGCFFGEQGSIPTAQMNALLANTHGRKSGLLFLPEGKPFYAFLKEASFEKSQDGKIIPYTLLFLEEESF